MDMSQVPEPLRARMAELEARPDLEKVRSLLIGCVADTDGVDEIRGRLSTAAQRSAYVLGQELSALEALLVAEHPSGTLFRLVSVTGDWPLDQPTDAEAAAFLHELAGWVRQAIDAAR